MSSTTTPQQLDRMRSYAADLSHGLGKVASKFVQDAVTGIYLARSVNLTELAHALDEDIAIHATQKRLSRNLGRSDIREVVNESLLTLAARRVHKDSVLVVHVRDLTKRYARKMQYLSASASSASQDHDGYKICEVVACEPDTDRYTPIYAHLWSSHAPGFVSDADEIVATIRRVLDATNRRGIVFPDPSVYAHGTAVEQLVAIEGMHGHFAYGAANANQGNRWFYRQKTMNDFEIAEACDTPYGVTIYKMHPDGLEEGVFAELGSIKVALASNRNVRGSVIITRYDTLRLREQPKLPFLVFSTCPLSNTRAEMTNSASILISGPQTVAVNLEHKNTYKLAGFRVLSYHRMKTLLTLLQATVFYEAAVTRRTRLVQRSGSLKPLPGNHPRTFLVPEPANS